jgi:hypothetical protein
MDDTCKTLTVSHGNFSCTLEDLSNPVATLKLITANFLTSICGVLKQH